MHENIEIVESTEKMLKLAKEQTEKFSMNGIYYYRLHLDIELQKLFYLYKSFFDGKLHEHIFIKINC